jgi:hypothetical protein
MTTDPESAFLSALRTVGIKQAAVDDEEKLAEASGVTVQNIWRHPDAHPVVLDYMLLEKYGPEWMLWEPETLQSRIPEEFKTQSLSDLNLSKIQACRTLHLVDSFWQRWEVFLWCTMAFNGEFPDFEVMQVPTVAQCLVAVDIANRLRDDVEFTLEAKTYLEAVHKYDGLLLPLPPLDFVTVDVSEVNVNLEDVKKRWPEVRSSEKAPKADTMEDEQLRRLLTVNQYLEESRARLQQQLRLIHG